MNTNVIMKRPLGSFQVEQRTRDGFFSATKLINAWNEQNPDQQRRLDNFWNSTHLSEFMAEIIKNDEAFKTLNSGDLEKASANDLKKVLSVVTKGKQGATWLHPMLFVKLAMYLSPAFEYQVLRFVSDMMIEYRKQAADSYKDLSKAVCSLPTSTTPHEMMQFVGNAVNHLEFGEHHKAARNDYGTERAMRKLLQRQQHITQLIKEGFITTYEQLQNYLRNAWIREHQAIPY